MGNWYYVVGSERVGPVSVESLKDLFLNDTINLETYVWKKGFQNWERLKDVSELNFDSSNSTPVSAPKAAQAPVENSPEVEFSFEWNKIRENDELFFVRIGKDRKNYDGNDIFGPYSLVELKEAITENRINYQSLVYAAGMSGWTKLEETPVNVNYRGQSTSISLNEVPLIMVFDYSPLPLVTIIKKAGTKDGVLLGAGPFSNFENKTVKASLYVGSEMKVLNVQVKVKSYDKRDQSIDCQFIDLNQDAQRIMLNHAI